MAGWLLGHHNAPPVSSPTHMLVTNPSQGVRQSHRHGCRPKMPLLTRAAPNRRTLTATVSQRCTTERALIQRNTPTDLGSHYLPVHKNSEFQESRLQGAKQQNLGRSDEKGVLYTKV